MSDKKDVVEVLASDLQGPGVVFCPNPKMTLWNQHPKVYIDLLKGANGEAACPYCGTQYRFTGERPKGHH